MELLQIILIGLSLSMDAFSLALVYGTTNLDKKMIRFLSILVGVFHFIMPFIGSILGLIIIQTLIPNPDKLVGIIFIVLSIEMLLSAKNLDTKVQVIKSISQSFLFAFSVSLDSFSVGIGLGSAGVNIILCGVIFSIISATFTLLGLKLGKHLALKYGRIANVVGSILLLFLGLEYFFQI